MSHKSVFRHMPHAAVAILASLLTISAHACDVGVRSSTASPSLESQVEHGLLPILRDLQARLLDERLNLEIDGVRVFDVEDKFLPGKIARGAAHLVVHAQDDSDRAAAVADFREAVALTLGQRNDSWGIYYYLSALYQLHQIGLLEDALDRTTLLYLRSSLDWRRFIDPVDYSTSLPTNYYGLAFGIARLRYLLGWEGEDASQILLARTIEHYRRYSGEAGFSDETEGQGRFDRYSVLLIAEIAHHFRTTGLDLTEEMNSWLRNSAEFVLVNLNAQGTGFQFGRSIGPYGDTGFLEVLSAAAWAGLLIEHEKDLAYAFSQRAFSRYLNVWYDADMGSVNLWEKGRRTDRYRGKHRILGENLSLTHQLLETNRVWSDLGYADLAVDNDQLRQLLQALPPVTLTRFSSGEPFRGALTFRDGDRVFSLWLVNGSRNLYDTTPYYPVPFSSGLIESVANAHWPQLVPRINFADGTSAMPLAYFHHVKLEQAGEGHMLSFEIPYLAATGRVNAAPDERVSIRTDLIFESGRIRRHDSIMLADDSSSANVELEFGSFAGAYPVEPSRFRFTSAETLEFNAEGFDTCSVRDVHHRDIYHAPQQRLSDSIRCRAIVEPGGTLSIRWWLDYDPDISRPQCCNDPVISCSGVTLGKDES